MKPLGAQYRQDPRIAMALMAQKQGASVDPVHTPLQGIARMLTAGVGGFNEGMARREIEEEQAAEDAKKSAAIKQALAMSQPSEIQWDSQRPDGTGAMTQAVPGDTNAAIGALAGTQPDVATALMGKSMMSDMDYQNKLRLALAKAKMGIGGDSQSAPVKNYVYRNKLVKMFGEKSPQVLQFDNYVRAQKTVDLGGSVVTPNPADPSNPLSVMKKTLKPGERPDVKALQSQATKSGGEIGTRMTKEYYSARDAADNIENIDGLITKLQTADDESIGFMSEFNAVKNKVLAKLGGKDALKKLTDKELINAMTGAEVFPLIKALGIGARGLDTPAERQFMREVLTGSTNLTRETLLQMAMKRRNAQERMIKNWNKRLNAGELDSFYNTSQFVKRPFDIPRPAPGGGKPLGSSVDSILDKYAPIK